MSVKKLLGMAGNDRGAYNEARVLEALRSDPPTWIRSSRPADNHEDRIGIDIVVTTDVGPLFLQVKSSRKGAERFNPRGRMIGVVVAGDSSNKKVRRRALAVLAELRKAIIAKRRRW